MKKRKLLIFGAFLSFLLFSCSYELEEPPPYEATPLDGFGIVDARAYFEEYATDLSYVRFTDTHAHTRSGVLESPELSPDWSHAVRTENGEAVLVEIPVNSELSPVSLVRRYDNGKLRLSRMSIVRVRLIVARRRDGTTQMFIATLVPSVKHSVDERDVENFRYLGGGNFTGTVFCSTLDGHFVEASEYVGGRFAGLLSVTTRQELAENGVSLDEASYESVRLTSGVKTRSGTYSFNEEGGEDGEDRGGGGNGGGGGYNGSGGGLDTRCPIHPAYKLGECPYCLDEVIVRVCRYCGRELEEGESCDCMNCSYCGRYPCECFSNCPECRPGACTKCLNCGRHYCYGDCMLPKEEGGGNSGGNSGGIVGGDNGDNGNDGNTGSEVKILPDVDLINEDHFVGYDVSKNCMKGCKDIMSNYGVPPGSSANVYQLLFEKDGILVYYDTKNYKTVYDNAIACINRHLDANRPIVVGVNHTPNKTINEGTTDHWIVVAGRGYDATKKQYYYNYMDTGRSSASDGCNTIENRLYYDSEKYTFRDSKATHSNQKVYDVSQVRPNDGKKLEETISQPARNSN